MSAKHRKKKERKKFAKLLEENTGTFIVKSNLFDPLKMYGTAIESIWNDEDEKKLKRLEEIE